MFQLLDQTGGKVIGLRLSGKLLHEDYRQFIPRLEALIQQHGSIRCLIEMTEFDGFELRALWDELKFDTTHATRIERCAVVGNKTWERWATNLCKPLFFKAKIQYFDASKMDEAWEWITDGVQAPVPQTEATATA